MVAIESRKQTSSKLILWSLFFIVTMVACAPAQSPTNVEVDATVAVVVEATLKSNVNLDATIAAAVAATVQTEQSFALVTPIPIETRPLLSTIPASASPDIEPIRRVIQAEVNAVVARDLQLLESLYAPDAVVVDRGGTPNDPSDDNVWRGWVNIRRRYEVFFSSGVSSITLVNLSIQTRGDEAVGVHQGVVLDDVFSPDTGVYSLRNRGGQWVITQLEYGNVPVDTIAPGSPLVPTVAPSGDQATNTDLYELKVGGQHRYEEPWGWDHGDPCAAWESDNFDDTKPNYRGFNLELLLTNLSDEKIPDEWPVTFSTANGNIVKACFYDYSGAGPPPKVTSSVTFFTVVEQGDYVDTITFNLNGNIVQLCLDGEGDWWTC